jgi:hypothetical protein
MSAPCRRRCMRVQCRQHISRRWPMELLVKRPGSGLARVVAGACAGILLCSLAGNANATERADRKPVASTRSDCRTDGWAVHRTTSMGGWTKGIRGSARGRIHSSVECPARKAAVVAGVARHGAAGWWSGGSSRAAKSDVPARPRTLHAPRNYWRGATATPRRPAPEMADWTRPAAFASSTNFPT